jgi:hypothetical protein
MRRFAFARLWCLITAADGAMSGIRKEDALTDEERPVAGAREA